MSSPTALDADAERLASFKRSLFELKSAMKQQRQVRNKFLHEEATSSPLTSPLAAMLSTSAPPDLPGGDRDPPPSTSNTTKKKNKSLFGWLSTEREAVLWILACAFLGAFLGFAIGCGWLTRGAGTYQYFTSGKRVLGAMSFKRGFSRRKAVRAFVVSPWRADLAKRVRGTLAYQLLTFKKAPWRVIFDMGRSSAVSDEVDQNQHWVANSPLWPPNWILFREVDLSQIDVGEGGLSPWTVSALSLVLPWRRNLIQALARKDRPKVNLRDQAGNTIEPSVASPSSKSSSFLSSGQSAQPINPYYHPMAFHTLREYIIRFDDGYVHPDLGFLVPAPSGAERGIGMVRDTYTKCQVHCIPGTAEEKLKLSKETRANLEESKLQEQIDAELMEEMKREFPDMDISSMETTADEDKAPTPSSPELNQKQDNQLDEDAGDPILNTTTYEGIQAAVELQQSSSTPRKYSQSEVLLRIPLAAQITRKTALTTLLGLLPPEQEGRSTHLEEMDDAFSIALYLAHERGLGVNSRIWPYIATLPLRPTCALHWGWKQSVVDVITAMSVEMGTDLQGWPNEISKAAELSERIVQTLSRAATDTLTLAKRTGADDVTENIRWALCQVASRAIAGRHEHGSLRLVPIIDMINHDAAADKFTELTGNETMEDGFFLDADETHSGTFVVRSRRHGEPKPLRRGQELMANYNVPAYSALDWFINMGFIPPERSGKWTMLEAGLPRSYRGGFSRTKSNTNNASNKDSGAFGSGKPEIQVIRQHTPQQQSCSR